MRHFRTLGLLAVVSIALGILRGDNSEQISIKLPFDAHQDKGGHGGSTAIQYHGGPILGGIVLSTSLPVRDIFAVLAVCPAVLAVCIYMVGRLHRRILGREALAAVEDVAEVAAH